jgi:hypothetical protein
LEIVLIGSAGGRLEQDNALVGFQFGEIERGKADVEGLQIERLVVEKDLSDCALVDFSPAGRSAVIDFTFTSVVATRK